mmetsp:Transcript_33423/g.80829  ORF Transcript_33423/g.80829 Transcript_33423/m.80829 type:complete len:150 (-) Transcript_33423:26-475(-)
MTKGIMLSSSADPMIDNVPKAQESPDATVPTKDDVMEDGSKDGSSSSDCPLFMNGLPSDFAANSGLAAIASLLDDDGGENADDDDGEKKYKKKDLKSTALVQSGGGKAKKTNKPNAHRPYSKEKNTEMTKAQKKVSLGETQLFLNMWKI